MEEESFIDAFNDVPTDLAGDYGQLSIFRTEDFSAWYRRVRDAHEREVDALRGETYLDAVPDSVLAKHGLVRMPVDAEGEPIHVGDVMEWPYGNGEFIVEGIGGNTLFYIDKDSGECEWTAAGDKRHRHEPTVEDVLREFGDWYAHTKGGCDEDGIIAEYAAKLRLADDGEEQ